MGLAFPMCHSVLSCQTSEAELISVPTSSRKQGNGNTADLTEGFQRLGERVCLQKVSKLDAFHSIS